MTDHPTVVQALSLVMGDVQAVKKAERNEQQRFNFRGIDAVMNAVGPALRKHGVVVLPDAEELMQAEFTTKTGTLMHTVTLRVGWVFYGPAGDSIRAVTYGEAADAGDKAVSKAHSVAYRTALLQALCIPTDEPDPDSSSYERTPAPARDWMGEINQAVDPARVRALWREANGAGQLTEAIKAHALERVKALESHTSDWHIPPGVLQ